MAHFLNHDITVHYKGTIQTIRSVDPDRYCYLELMEDICELSLSHISATIGLSMTVYCIIPHSDRRFVVRGDKELMQMFEMHALNYEINVFLETENIEGNDHHHGPPRPTGPSSLPSSSRPTGQLNLDVGDHGVGDQKRVEVSDDEVYADEIYGFSSEDDDWNGEGESQSDSTDFSEDDSVEEINLHKTDDELSDYESGDECGSDSSLEEDMDGIHRHQERAKDKLFDQCLYGKEFHVDDGGKVELEKGLLFTSVHHFRQVLRDFTIQEGFKLVRDKNEKRRVTCHCAAKGCGWRVHASPLPDQMTFMIKKYNPIHTCVRKNTNREANSTWIARKLGKRFKANPEMNLDAMQTELQEKWGIEASRMQLYRAKRKALDEIEGSHTESYVLLPKYGYEVRRSNPGSLVRIETNRPHISINPSFKRIFISFEAQKTGFNLGCRPFIGLDGCHLKGPYGGVLLVAVSLDGNNGLFPLSISVVESENRDSWTFFLNHLCTIIGADTQARPWTFMSDQQKGLDTAIAEILPEATHRRCCRHLFSNFKSRFPGLLLKRYFWQAARAYNQLAFGQKMELMKDVSPDAYNWLSRVPTHSWARHAFDARVKNDHITNNLSESFNNWVGHLRFKPILSLLEGIRTKLMGRIHKRFENGSTWHGVVTPNIRKKLNKAQESSRYCTVIFAGGEEYEVIEEDGRHVVHLDERMCDCREWDISGLPCKHAACAISYKRAEIEEYCDPCFSKERYISAYDGIIHPVQDQRLWEEVPGDPLEPPPLRRLPGRPRKNRRRGVDEPTPGTSAAKRGFTLRCKNCNQFGHNKRTCQRAPVRGKVSGRGNGRGSSNMPSSQGDASQSGTENPSQGVTQLGGDESGQVLSRGRGTRRGRGTGRGKGRSVTPLGSEPSAGGTRGRGIGRKSASSSVAGAGITSAAHSIGTSGSSQVPATSPGTTIAARTIGTSGSSQVTATGLGTTIAPHGMGTSGNSQVLAPGPGPTSTTHGIAKSGSPQVVATVQGKGKGTSTLGKDTSEWAMF